MGNLCTVSDIAPSHQRSSLFCTFYPLHIWAYRDTYELQPCLLLKWAYIVQDMWIHMTNKDFKKPAWMWHFSLVPSGELNRTLEWKPNTNKGNKVNSNRWKKSSGRHLVSRNAPCRESEDDWKKRKNGKSGTRKKLKGKLCRATFSWFVQSRRTMSEILALLGMK